MYSPPRNQKIPSGWKHVVEGRLPKLELYILRKLPLNIDSRNQSGRGHQNLQDMTNPLMLEEYPPQTQVPRSWHMCKE